MCRTTILFFILFFTVAAADVTGQHSWELSMDSVAADFGQGALNEFAFLFNHNDVSSATPVSLLMDPTCTTTLVDSGLTAETVSIGATQATATVSVDFSSLIGSIWTDSTTEGTLSFCYRLDVEVDGYSVNHVSVIVTATLDLENDMSISSIDVQDKVANNESVNISIDYPLTAKACDAEFNEVVSPTALAPGDTISICVAYSAGVSGVHLGSVYSSVLSQDGGYTFATIADGTVLNSFTSVDCATLPDTCRITTTVIGAFFADDSLPVQISGTALMSIGRRMVEVPVKTAMRRKTGQVTTDDYKLTAAAAVETSDFGLELALTGTQETASSTRRNTLLWSSLCTAALFAGLV